MDITEKFEDRHSFLHWFIIASLTGIEITDKIRSHPMLVTMQINGQEVNPVNSINRLEDQFNRMVEDKACAMLESMRTEIDDKLDLGFEDLECIIKKGYDL